MKKIALFLITIALLLFLKTNKTSAQTCSTTPPSNTGTINLSTTTNAGTYRVWARILAPDTTNNSFYLQIDGGCPILVGDSASIPPNTWTWIDYQNGNTSSVIDLPFTSGNHALTVTGNEPGVGVDKLLLTQDLTCVPSGTSGSNCPSSTPTPTTVITTTPTPTPIQTPSSTPTPTPTPTPLPNSPTPIPNSTILRFVGVKLHGIGTAGDNTNPNLGGNTSPLTTTRTLSADIIDSNGNLLTTVTGNITYNPTLGYFTGDITVPNSLLTGSYLVKVKSSGYLKKQIPGIVTITQFSINPIAIISLTTGDINNDNSLTISDYNILIDCYSDLLPAKNCSDPAKKASADISNDGNVNANDYNLFLRELSVVSGD